MIAIVTYNTLPLLSSSDEVKVFENIFNPKSPESVSESDPIFLDLMKSIDSFDSVIIFAGKKSSGSLEMIHLFARLIEHQKLFFVLCDHNLEEKISLLRKLMIHPDSYFSFCDNNHIKNERCDEQRIILGLVYEYLLTKPDE